MSGDKTTAAMVALLMAEKMETAFPLAWQAFP